MLSSSNLPVVPSIEDSFPENRGRLVPNQLRSDVKCCTGRVETDSDEMFRDKADDVEWDAQSLDGRTRACQTEKASAEQMASHSFGFHLRHLAESGRTQECLLQRQDRLPRGARCRDIDKSSR